MPPGIRIKIDGDEPISLQYAGCTPKSCQAQVELTNHVLDRMRKGNQMLVAAISVQQKPLTFRVLLNGFATTSDGVPVDEAKYRETRARAIEFAKRPYQQTNQQGRSRGISAACPAYHDNSDTLPGAGTAITSAEHANERGAGVCKLERKEFAKRTQLLLAAHEKVGVRQPSSRASHTRATRKPVLAVPVESTKVAVASVNLTA